MFEAEISQPWKNKVDEIALEKLQSLVRMIALRRPGTVIMLPDRHEILHHVQLTTEESIVYDNARKGTIEIIESALLSENPTGSAYISAFQRINDLRYICNHGVFPTRNRRNKNNRKRSTTQKPDSFQEELDKLLTVSTPACLDCGTDIDEVSEHSNQLLAVSAEVYCGNDFDEVGENRDRLLAVPSELCQDCFNRRKACSYMSPRSSDSFDMDDTNSASPREPYLSSKIRALISHVQKVSQEEKWYRKFSSRDLLI